MASMTKADLLEQISSKTSVKKAEAEKVLDAFFDTVTETAKRGGKVGWPGFGMFTATNRPARTGRNPQTGLPVAIAASTAMKFSTSSVLKEKLNK